jgi:hypothetical protein
MGTGHEQAKDIKRYCPGKAHYNKGILEIFLTGKGA